MARIEKTVFISYRRKDISWALAVYQYLTSQKYDVFFDYTSIPSGDFEQIIVSNIRARAHFVLILTPTALDRCSEPGDWLRREIETAIDEKRNIIPLFFDGFSFGSQSVAEKLTEKLSAVKRYNGLDIPSGYFIEAMQRLSNRYLDVPLNAVIHPVSTEVRKAVKEEQIAVSEALAQKWEDIKELLKPAEEKTGASKQQNETTVTAPSSWGKEEKRKGKPFNVRSYGFLAGILLVAALGIVGINEILQNRDNQLTPTMTGQIIPSAESSVTMPLYTATVEIKTPIPIDTMTPEAPTLTSVPTLGIGSIMISDKDDMTLLYVPEGEFTMGLDDDKYETDNPTHKIILSAFWIDQTEVTNGMYQKCVDAKVCESPYSVTSGAFKSYYGNSAFSDFPVIHIPWKQAWNYCEWAERRLPTEAEWEKAARGATDERIYPWGDDEPYRDVANFGGLVGNTTSVYTQVDGASPYGVLNMAGNVWEWVADFYDPDYYHKSLSKDPQGPILTDKRVMRGGSWKDYPSVIRVVHRYADYPQSASNILGFRCADSPIK